MSSHDNHHHHSHHSHNHSHYSHHSHNHSHHSHHHKHHSHHHHSESNVKLGVASDEIISQEELISGNLTPIEHKAAGSDDTDLVFPVERKSSSTRKTTSTAAKSTDIDFAYLVEEKFRERKTAVMPKSDDDEIEFTQPVEEKFRERKTAVMPKSDDDEIEFTQPVEEKFREHKTAVMPKSDDDEIEFTQPVEKKPGDRRTAEISKDESAGVDVAMPVDKKHKAHNSSDTPASMHDANDFIYARYHGKRNHIYSSHNYESEHLVRSTTESKHHHHKHKSNKRKTKWKERTKGQKALIILAWIFGTLAGLVLVTAISVAILSHIGLVQLTDYSQLDMTAPENNPSVTLTDNGRRVTYNGQDYIFNDNMTSILCIGVDKTELGLEDNRVGTAGQSDALYLVALDTKTGATKVIAIPRDIVTDIGIYSEEGEYLRTEKMQICLAYAYGDGRKTSCLNTVTAVSRLFYQLPVNSYFAINLSAISELNDAVGGVTVTMLDSSFYDTNNVRHNKGETLTLHGDDARKYLQYREVKELDSSLDRLDRQVNYLKSFSSKAITMTKQDISTPVSLYNIVAGNSETNLTPAKMTAFGTCIVSNGINELDFVQVPGELTSDGTYAQYIVDEEKLYELILDTYYTPVN